ncbi:MAG: S8 family serine peptidase [Planctomycetota bacterium]|jgi:thermitase
MTSPHRHVLRALLLALLAAPALFAQVGLSPGDPVAQWRDVEVVPDELIIRFADDTQAAARAATHARFGAAELATLAPGLVRVALPAGADLDAFIGRYATDASVRYAQPNVLHRPAGVPNDLKWAQQWGMTTVRAHLAWDVAAGDPSVIIAVLDSGADMDHPDLAAKIAWDYDTASMDDDADDQTGHGTHCMGVAAAETNNVVGVAGAGNACRLAAYRCGDATFSTAALVLAIHDAVDQGAHVLSMSWGSIYEDTAVAAALQYALGEGCVLVAAAGNNGDAVPFYPAAHPFVIAVAATNSLDNLASFSNYGPWVELAAPGQSITSTWTGGVYKYASGTSMATPMVAGTAALLYAELGGQRTTDAAALIRGALEGSAVPVGSFVQHGRLDMRAAVDAIAPIGPPVLAGISPASVAALGGDVTLSGSGLSSVTSLSVDGVAVTGFSAPDDGTLVFAAPAATALGATTVEVVGATGATDSIALGYVEAEPPVLLAPASVAAGDTFQWTFAGGVAHGWSLLISLTPATFTYGGFPILANMVFLDSGVLGPVGSEARTVLIPPAAVGVTFHSQVVTFAGGFHAATPVVSTTITP